MKNWSLLAPFLSSKVTRITPDTAYFKQKTLIIDPETHTLFTGMQSAKMEMMHIPLDGSTLGDITIPGVMGPVPFRRMVDAAINEVQSNKAENYAKRFYSHINRTIYGVEKFQIDNDADIIIGSYVPITSPAVADRQIEEQSRLIRDSARMFRRVFSAASSTKELMSMIALNVNILESEYLDPILDLAATGTAEHVGLKFLNFDDKDNARASTVLRFIERLRSRLDEQDRLTPIHLFDVWSEFAYAAYCHGAISAVSRIAAPPGLHFDPNNPTSPELKGRYYHRIDMTYDTFTELCAKTEANDFKLPCDCPSCRISLTVKKAELRWPTSRKFHFIYVKSDENSEIRKVPAETLNTQLKDKFARSQATSYLPHLDYMYHYARLGV